MRGMILAAGRGDRMRPLTDSCPKPLLEVNGKPLIVWQIERLRAAGIVDLVINVSWLGDLLIDRLGDGRKHGVRIRYSIEPKALETGGGIATALPLLTEEPFVVVSGDIWCDYDFGATRRILTDMHNRHTLAHLVLVPNPVFHPDGDFTLDTGSNDDNDEAQAMDSLGLSAERGERYTFGNIGVYHPRLFDHVEPHVPLKLVTIFHQAIGRRLVTAEVFKGRWYNLGTPEQLTALDDELRRQKTEAADKMARAGNGTVPRIGSVTSVVSQAIAASAVPPVAPIHPQSRDDRP